jgi:hypothetical protein
MIISVITLSWKYIVPVHVLAGAQVAVKAWSRGGFFIDLHYNVDVIR